jgi:prevent-host-death family protein
MTRVNAQAPEARLPDLLARVARGEEVVIVERGKPVAKVVPHPQRERNYRSIVGCWKGRVDVSGADEADKAIYRKLGMLA